MTETPGKFFEKQDGSPAFQHERTKAESSSRPGLRHLATSLLSSGDYTMQQVRRQVEALGCDRFEVGILPPEHRLDLKAQAIRIFSALQLVTDKVIGWLRRMNALGYDIYCRPAVPNDGMRHPLIFVDDLSAEKIETMRLAGLPVSVLVESSRDNFHGWVRLGVDPISGDEALCAARTLAVLFGGDRGAVSSRQFGRLSGFTNKKAKHASPRGAPFSILRASNAEVAPQGQEFLEIVRASIQRDNVVVTAQVGRRRAASDLGEKDSDRAAAVFLVARAKIRVVRNDGTVDESAADFGAAAAMMDDGWDPADVCCALFRASPNIEARHHDVGDYVARTIAAAERAAPAERSSRALAPVLRPRR